MARFSKKQYFFGCTKVFDGDKSGLLVERYENEALTPQYAYFWLENAEGLQPPSIIRKKCCNNCFPIECSDVYKGKPKKKARAYNFERIYKELLAYTDHAGSSGDYNIKKKLDQDYSKPQKGYPAVISDIFRSESKFAEFFRDYNTFKKCVLEKHFDDDIVVGNAGKFDVRNVSDLFPEENLIYFTHLGEILEVDHPGTGQWFRDIGPLYSDFKNKKYYRRDEVDIIKRQIRKNNFYLLKGDAATAKSVIVRTVIYELYKAGKRHIYYFDFRIKRDVNEHKLSKNIEDMPGLFIIENIHLEPVKAQYIYQKFKNNPHKQILFTSRTGFEQFQNSELYDSLVNIPYFELTPFKDVEKLIKEYCRSSKTSSVVWNHRQDIIDVSKKDFWFLVYAIRGCEKLKGKESPQDWLREGVRSKLRNLENCRDRHCEQYPGILVALAPLYKKEVLTAESFLLKSGFTKTGLNALVRRREITRHIEDNQRFYGLIHSSHADAYWEHGKEYAETSNYHEFLLQYACSGTSNGLRSIMSADDEIRDQLLKKLCIEADITKTIAREQDIKTVDRFITRYLDVEIRCPENIRRQILTDLGKKVTYVTTLDMFWSLCDKVENIWDYVYLGQFTARITDSSILYIAKFLVVGLVAYGKKIPSTLCKNININKISTMLNENVNPSDVIFCFVSFVRANRNRANEIWKLMDKKTLADRLVKHDYNIKSDYFEKTGNALESLYLYDRKKGYILWKELDISLLAQKCSGVRTGGEVCSLNSLLCSLLRVNPEGAKNLCGLMNTDELASYLNQGYGLSSNATNTITTSVLWYILDYGISMPILQSLLRTIKLANRMAYKKLAVLLNINPLETSE